MDGKWTPEDFERAISTGIQSVADALDADFTATESVLPAEDAECTHRWATCPVHGTGTGELPPFPRVLSCIYGGAITKNGTPWDDRDSAAVAKRVVRRLRG